MATVNFVNSTDLIPTTNEIVGNRLNILSKTVNHGKECNFLRGVCLASEIITITGNDDNAELNYSVLITTTTAKVILIIGILRKKKQPKNERKKKTKIKLCIITD